MPLTREGAQPPSGCAEYPIRAERGYLIFSAQVTPVTRDGPREYGATPLVGTGRRDLFACARGRR